jgi:hypothetical protein
MSERRRLDDPYPTDDEIAQRTYEMFLDESSSSVGAVTCWRLAETELLERSADRVLRTYSRRYRHRKP